MMGLDILNDGPEYKIIEQDESTLEKSENPFAMVVLTVLLAVEIKKVDR